MQNVRPHPTSTPLHDTFFSVTFECDCPFLLQFDVAGDGSTTTNIKMNTIWLCNTSRTHPVPTPLHDTFDVKVLCDLRKRKYTIWPFFLQVDVAGGWDGTTKLQL
jgi:hypothetical protein